MHWTLRLLIRTPILFPIFVLVVVGRAAEMAGDWLVDNVLPRGLSTDARGRVRWE